MRETCQHKPREITSWMGGLCATGQKVGDLKPEHIGQLGEVLWAGVAAASFPGVDVLTGDSECVADLGECEFACLTGGFDGVADHCHGIPADTFAS